MTISRAWWSERFPRCRFKSVGSLRVSITVLSFEPLLPTCLVSLPLLLPEGLSRIPVLASRPPIPATMGNRLRLLKLLLRILW